MASEPAQVSRNVSHDCRSELGSHKADYLENIFSTGAALYRLISESRGSILNVCMITKEFPPGPGGIGYFVYSLSKKLVERGHEVSVITRGSAKTRSKIIDGINVVEAPYLPLYPFHIQIHGLFVKGILNSIERRANLVHFHSPIVPPIRTCLPALVTAHTPMKVDARFQESDNLYLLAAKMQSLLLYPRIESKLFGNVKRITTVCRSVALELAEYGIDPHEVKVIGNGVDEKFFFPLNNNRRKGDYVLYTGVLRARKGLFDLIKCAEHVSKQYPRVRFVILGKGPLFSLLKENVRRLGLEKNVVFLGYVSRDKLVEVYQEALIHVVPSIYEGLPTVLLEAMACGLPVVATTVGGNAEVISSGVNGFLVSPWSPLEMSEKVRLLLSDERLRERLGTEARRTIEKHYTWDRIADNVQECYEEVAQH